ncbi:MAG TPA: phosphatase PAP2 family protein [Candidatus Baltobacteraceae bacterium]|jgi:undecaprenyl-diphosphatase|nr:phosphatase PAP2 family protein [Candidatus Baltobacteraceae bacterium]
MKSLDVSLFQGINGMAGRSDALDAFFVFCATYLIFLMIALVLAYVAVSWKTTHFEGRVENLAHVVWAVAIGFLLERVIGFLWFRPRPFVVLEGVTKLADRMATEKSFPSAHATFAFALAAGVALHNKKWGNALFLMAALVAFGRVAAGVHYPSDVVAGALVGLLAGALASPVKKGIEPYLEFLPVFRTYKRRDV